MSSWFRSIIRTSAFWRKEIYEILRQPRMIFSLILGPFLILLIFGLGYSSKAPTFRTLFVAPADSQIAQHIQEYVQGIGPSMIYAGVTSNEAEALDRLHRGEVDLVAVAPPDVNTAFRNNKQASFTIYNDAIDPVTGNWAQFYAYIYTTEINRRVLMSMVDQSKPNTQRLQKDIEDAHASVNALRTALRAGDKAAASQNAQSLSGNLNDIALAAGIGMAVLGGAQEATGSGSGSSSDGVTQSLQGLRTNANSLESGDAQTQLQRADQIDQQLTQLESELQTYQNLDPEVVVSPFTNQVKSTIPINITPTDFYAPAVLALLLQHLALTLAALSIVRERSVGTMELFRVSPVTATETLFGKYVSYMLFGVVIAAVLVALLIYVLHVPMLGNWVSLALVIGGILFTSISIGFVISLVSQTDSQAVQYTMLALLASVFFGGLLLNLEALLPPVRVISGLLPTTYGIILLRDIMLRGAAPDFLPTALLFALGIVLCIVAGLMLRRLISRAQR